MSYLILVIILMFQRLTNKESECLQGQITEYKLLSALKHEKRQEPR